VSADNLNDIMSNCNSRGSWAIAAGTEWTADISSAGGYSTVMLHLPFSSRVRPARIHLSASKWPAQNAHKLSSLICFELWNATGSLMKLMNCTLIINILAKLKVNEEGAVGGLFFHIPLTSGWFLKIFSFRSRSNHMFMKLGPNYIVSIFEDPSDVAYSINR